MRKHAARPIVLLGGCAALLCASLGAQEKTHGGVLAVKPLGEVDDEALSTVKASIEASYGWEVKLLPASPLPASAWYKPRKRHRAEVLLSVLAKTMPAGSDKIMGLTTKDISTTKGAVKDWGICGLADIDGPASVVSTYRIKKKMGKLSPKERHAKYLQRLVDLAAHEFGHQLGLDHCPHKGCVMEDAKGTVLTFDHSSGELCDACKAALASRGLYIPAPK